MKAKPELTTLGTQRNYAVYEPDAKGLANGLAPSYTSMTVTVSPHATKKGHGKAKDVLLGFRGSFPPASAIPACRGPRALKPHR